MKIVCDCGEEIKFVKHDDWDDLRCGNRPN
jgi:hypothetical protein